MKSHILYYNLQSAICKLKKGLKILSIIKVEDLTHIYSEGTPFQKCALDKVNFELQKGDFIGIIGHTGSGKSTLVSHFNGLLKPTSGKVFVNDRDIWLKKDKKSVHFQVGLVFQYPEYQLFEETVYKDIAFGPKNMGLSSEEIDKRVKDALKFVGLDEDILGKSPFEISGGQKRRVAIAGVISMQPEVLILDEPTAGLDPKGKEEILAHIREYHKQNNSTVIIVSHNMEEIAKNVNSVLVMNKSKIHSFGSVDYIFERAKELSEIGLSIPQITKVFMGLKEKGFDVKTNIFTVKQACEEIIRVKKMTIG